MRDMGFSFQKKGFSAGFFFCKNKHMFFSLLAILIIQHGFVLNVLFEEKNRPILSFDAHVDINRNE